jgi:hypothetical protein
MESDLPQTEHLQLDLEDLPVPASQLGQPIVGDHIRPALRIGQMVQPNAGDAFKTKALGGLDAAVAGNARLSESTRTGLLKPNLPIEAAIWGNFARDTNGEFSSENVEGRPAEVRCWGHGLRTIVGNQLTRDLAPKLRMPKSVSPG